VTREKQKRILQRKYRYLLPMLNERLRRCWAATEAQALGYGGLSMVCQAIGIDHKTVQVGLREMQSKTKVLASDRIRKAGGGRKKLTEKDRDLTDALDKLIEPTERGDPETPLRWTCESTTNLAAALNTKGHRVSQRTVHRMLVSQGYSLQANRKTEEGTRDHPDREAQFRYISQSVKKMQTNHQPVISVDTKKKENVGNFKNQGQEWRKKDHPRRVNLHDFVDPNLGKVIPYGVYDLSRNEGWVTVGVTDDTASFAVASIRQWWKRMGRKRYVNAKELLITADSGGSNASRSRLWKKELQQLANTLKITIHVRHFPPGTSKWNKVEHRLFSFISQNWRGKPLLSRSAVVNLIANTKTKTGLTVKAILDENDYETGVKVSDEEMESLNLVRESFHGEWNYKIKQKQK